MRVALSRRNALAEAQDWYSAGAFSFSTRNLGSLLTPRLRSKPWNQEFGCAPGAEMERLGRILTICGNGSCGTSRAITESQQAAFFLLVQERTSKSKLFSLHVPEVVCITKGEAHRPYEFGAKVALAVNDPGGFCPRLQVAGGQSL